MKTLKEILSVQQKFTEISSLLGFENLRICVLDDPSQLCFVVDNNPTITDYDNDVLLKSILSIYLDCEVSVLVSNRISSYLQEGILSRAVALNNEQQIMNLFNCTDSSQIKFAGIGENTDKEALQGLAEIGENKLKQFNSTLTLATFWNTTKQTDVENVETEKLNEMLKIYESMNHVTQQKAEEEIKRHKVVLSQEYPTLVK